jgi:sporulation protein YlmC with PRC-barrel domain
MYGTLRDYKFNKDIDDIRGSAVYGFGDEKLGKIDDVIFDSNTGQIRYLVVDTGGWLKSRRFLVPPEHVQPKDDKDFKVSLTKSEIEKFPALDERVLESEKDFNSYETNYRSSWSSQRSPSQSATVATQSPLSPRFLRFQDEVARDRERICGVGSSVSRRRAS